MGDFRCDGSKCLAGLKMALRDESMALIKCRNFRGRRDTHGLAYVEYIKLNNVRVKRLIHKLEAQIDNIARKRKEGVYK